MVFMAARRIRGGKGEAAGKETRMTKNEFLREIETVIEADPGTLKGDEALSQVPGWDSMAVMAFIAMVDKKMGVILSPQKLAGCRSVPDLIDLLQKHISES